MKTLVLSLVLLATIATAFAVEDAVEYLRARSTGTTVVLDWRSSDEGQMKHFEIERAGEDQVFRYVAMVTAKGNNSAYQFTDEEAFGKRDAADGAVTSTYFTYRLKLVYSDQPASYTATAGVSHSVSSVRRTWGMIKEMFR